MIKRSHDLVILGGVAAGTSAAAAAIRENKEKNVAIYQKEPFISYGGCGLPYAITGDVKNVDDVIAFTPEKFEEKKGAKVFTEHEAYDVDFDKKVVYIKNSKENIEVSYDKLVISTGASPIMPNFDAIKEDGVFKMRNPDDDKSILNYIDNKSPKKAVVIGGGFIGVETTEGLLEKGIEVDLIEGLDSLMGDIEPELHEDLLEKMKDENVRVHLNNMVKNIIKNGFEVQTDNQSINTEMVIVAIGVKPNTQFLKDSGLKMLKNGAIIINEKSETNIKDVYSAGDCATVKHLITGENTYFPLGTTANKQGKIAGKNVFSKKPDEFKGIIGSFITKFKDLEYTRTGLTYETAIEKGFNADFVVIKSRSRAGYYNGGGKIKMKLIFEKKSGRILGAHYIGKEVHARINTMVSLIYKNATIYDLLNMDLPYAPPFSPVWDINLIAASQAIKKI
jgi:NADPH-dependent 2,4-dienoyl-CoA reductase/sulfur reductase-like enzyme